MAPDDSRLRLKTTLNLDGKWSTQMSEQALLEYLAVRLNSCLGFRGHVKKIRVLNQNQE